MANVFCLEPEEDFPEVFGIVANLSPWKMCYLVSNLANIELIHEDAFINAPPPIQLVKHNSLINFEKYVWLDQEHEQFIFLIQNKVKAKVTVDTSSQNNTLFDGVIENEQEFLLLDEWKDVNYLIKTEGCEAFFEPNHLKAEKGIRMVLKSTLDQFKNYDKLV